MKHITMLALIVLFSNASTASENADIPFYDRIDSLSVEERYVYLANCIHDASMDIDIKRLAFKEFATMAIARNLTESAILAMESLLHTSLTGSDTYQAAYLAKAKLLFYSDKQDTAETMFQTAIDANWRMDPKQPAHWLYIDCLNDTNQFWKSAIVEYGCIAKPNTWITEDDAHFLRFYRWTILEQWRNPFDENLKKVLLFLNTNKKDTTYKIARAFLLASQNRAADAFILFDEIERSCNADPHTPDAKEALNIPLYKCAVMYVTDYRSDTVKDEMYRYLELNKDDPERALKRLYSIVYTMEQLNQYTMVRVYDVTMPLIEHELIKTEGSISEEQKSHLLDLHLSGLLLKKSYDEALAFADELLDKYYPNYGAGIDAAYVKGYILRTRGQYDEAEALQRSILENTSDPSWKKRALEALVMTCEARGDDPKEFILPTLQKLEQTAPPNEKNKYAGYAKKFKK